ncbi:MAG: MFS transporter, partial [Bryobacteraceae bacterium]|nr:MFS transporter [Bryobacteraceae bacterium]
MVKRGIAPAALVMNRIAEFAGRHPSLRALRHRDYRLYAAGHTVSLIGTWMQGVAQSWLVYRLTHSETMLGLTLFATHFPVLLLGPLGGLAADRFSRRRVVLVTQTVSLVQALILAGLTF